MVNLCRSVIPKHTEYLRVHSTSKPQPVLSPHHAYLTFTGFQSFSVIFFAKRKKNAAAGQVEIVTSPGSLF